MTDGGLGVAFFSPFDTKRYFLPWRPIHVSPIAIHRFFSTRGFAILQSELLWIWLPAILFAAMVVMLRRKSQPDVVMPNESADRGGVLRLVLRGRPGAVFQCD